MADEDAIEWARAEAGRLRQSSPSFGPVVSKGVEFLRLQAPKSTFYKAASDARSAGSNEAGYVAEALDQWADFVEAGLASSVPYEAQFRVDAATDLMEQVEVLLRDRHVHPAVSVMVAGAALEEFLRSMFEQTTEAIAGQRTLSKYGEALTKAEVIDRHMAHQVTSMAATRNEAAHGHFDKITPDLARLFVAQVNLFIAQNKKS